jgi:NAD(P)-dependent dehydrogenase (short-subunit alcohol dehydrogenase family)
MPVALITGGAGMLGRGAARALVDDGWQVVLADLDTREAEKVAADLGGKGKAAVDKADALDLESMTLLAGRVAKAYGAIDGLVCAAGGIDAPRVEFADSKPEHWNTFMQMVLRTVMNANHAVLPQMIRQGKGTVVNIASGAGLRGGPPHLRQQKAVVYGACKAGVITFTQSVAVEVGPKGVRINSVAPGRTESRRKSQDEMDAMEKREESVQKGASRQSPLGRRLTKEDVGNAIAFLMSERASHVTGSCIDLTGGIRLY